MADIEYPFCWHNDHDPYAIPSHITHHHHDGLCAAFDRSEMAATVCPFCDFYVPDQYNIFSHIERHHPEDYSSVVDDDDTPPPIRTRSRRGISPPHFVRRDTEWTRCPRRGCGDHVHVTDIDEHLEMHEAVDAVETQKFWNYEEPSIPRRRASPFMRNDWAAPGINLRPPPPPPPPPPYGHISTWEYPSGMQPARPQRTQARPQQHRRPPESQKTGRLGTLELGPHAFERVMPTEVRRRLLNDALPRQVDRIDRHGRRVREYIVENETADIIPALADLCSLTPNTEVTYLCHPSTRHVYMIECEGNFCGYWNIQMLLSYVHRHQRRPRHYLETYSPLPNVLQIQDGIEQAWDRGICAYGRVETGGVRGTRKWIGTQEALAYFTQTGVSANVVVFQRDHQTGLSAAEALLDHIEAYFISGVDAAERQGTSYTTRLPPIYFQQHGHSTTIVGFTRKRDGSRALLIFDPSSATAGEMQRLIDRRHVRVRPEALLPPYTRHEEGLHGYNEFEIISLRMPE